MGSPHLATVCSDDGGEKVQPNPSCELAGLQSEGKSK